jgi:DNA-binding PadR family transcriptional regulator
MQRMRRNRLSTPEYTILGVLWRDGPCTTYNVMMRLASSSSSFHRKRASSTYSVVEKLVSRGLVASVDGEIGSRGERQMLVTAEGRDKLREWIADLPTVEVGYSNDLVRLRLNFIELLARDEQLAFVDHALSSLRAVLLEHESATERYKQPIASLSLLGLVYETKARIAWMEEVRARLRSDQ